MKKLGNGKVNSPKNKWFEDDNGRFKWSSGCSFPKENVLSSDDVNKIKMNLFSSCPENCYKDNRCTHFVYTKGHCHLKELKTVDASPEAAVPDNPGGFCGFLVQRPVQYFFSIDIFYYKFYTFYVTIIMYLILYRTL